MKPGFIVAALIVALLAGWLVLGRQLTFLVDTFATAGDTQPTTGPFTASSGWLDVGKIPLELAEIGGERDAVRIDTDDAGRVTLNVHGKTFPLGARAEQTNVGMIGPFDTPFAPDPGDSVTFRVAHSVIAWPTPLDLNFMTGNSPSWKRHVYYTLTWRKADGAELTLIWRYEQWFYDDWGSPQMIREGATGLLSARITGGR
jgi:hypothetical protein